MATKETSIAVSSAEFSRDPQRYLQEVALGNTVQ